MVDFITTQDGYAAAWSTASATVLDGRPAESSS